MLPGGFDTTRRISHERYCIGRAATWIIGFVNIFGRVPLLACIGSREAVVQLWNSKTKFYKTSYPSCGPS